MRFLNHLNRFGQYLRRGRQGRRPDKFLSRPRLEGLESRMLLSTLSIDSAGHAVYTAGAGVANNLTLSQQITPLPFPFTIERVFTDTAEKITVTGAGAGLATGSGTNQVIVHGDFAISTITVDGVDGADVVNVQSINVPTAVKHSGPGSLTVNVGNNVNGVQAISAPLTVNAGGGVTNVNVDNSADSGNHPNVTLSASAIENLAPAAITYLPAIGGNLFVHVTGGNGGNIYTVTNTPVVSPPNLGTMTLDTGSGTNHVNVRHTSGLLAIHGHGGTDQVLVSDFGGVFVRSVIVSNTTNSTTLVVDNSAAIVPQAATIGPNSVEFPNGIGGQLIQFGSGVKSVNVFGGANTTFLLESPSPTTPVTVHGGPGANTLVSGGLVNNWILTGTNAGTVQNVSFQNVQNLQGGALANASDTFVFNNGAGVTGTIQRGSGPSSVAMLDYSKYITPVTVNLKTHAATGVTGGVFGVQNVIGGQANNILVGDGNNNVLKGGSGRDILISGGGNSTLQAGSGQAILLGAHPAFDTNIAALNALMAEWSHTYDSANPLKDYQIRVGHLLSGGGLNGGFLLNKSTVAPQPGSTTLTSGAQLDFLIADAGDILTKPVRPGEVELSV
jgi:hypothetical protein